MANINLLPWRESQRRDRNRVAMLTSVAMCIAALATVFIGGQLVESQIDNQNNRNAFLQSEIDSLSRVIYEIEDLRGKRDALIDRMQVIQNLQENRAQIVHVFDDLASKLPKGVYYENIDKNDDRLRIDGKAQSNGRVSALMRNLDASEWFTNPDLKVVDVIDENGAQLSDFDIEIKESRKNRPDDTLQDDSEGYSNDII